MPDISIHRDHQLGLKAARKVAWAWAEQAEADFGMACTVLEGETSDTVEFSRSGVNGQLIVAADHFDLQAKLVDGHDGAVVASRNFRDTEAVVGEEVDAVVTSMSRLLDRTTAQVVGWTLAEGEKHQDIEPAAR